MLKKLYVDNYRCLVNFEVNFSNLSLLIGENGSGKTTVFEVLRYLQAFVSGDVRLRDQFLAENLTRWQTRDEQVFELELVGNGGTYAYRLVIEHKLEERKLRVAEETLRFDGKPLFGFSGGTVQLYRDNHSEGPTYPFDWSQSGLATILPRGDNKKLAWFQDRMAKIIVAGLQPAVMTAETREDSRHPARNMENFSSWYRFLVQEQSGSMFDLTKMLREVVDGFHSFRLPQLGERSRVLEVGFSGGEHSEPVFYRFNELSDGQRVLICLYTLLFAVQKQGYSLFLDEPENYLALPEIQPWLLQLSDLCGDGVEQAVLISHHPELINYLGRESGVWFEREPNGPTRVKYEVNAGDSGLDLAELAARRWLE